jgi:UDP-N-acetylglucosamine:LPS N-acetylglucosamine transferase
MPKIALVYIDSGGGHRAAANALTEVIRRQGRSWDIELLSIQDLLNRIDFIRKYTGIPFQDIYNIMLRRGWTFGSAQLIPLMHWVIRLSHRSQVRELTHQWALHRPDLVVSLIPHYNRALREALANACPRVPFVTVLTDIADYPPHFWIENQDQYVICGSEQAARQAFRLGLPGDRILRTSGMILHPRFSEHMEVDRRSHRRSLGLDPDLPTALVLFGGEGSYEMVRIAEALNRKPGSVQLICLCGKNQEVAQKLRDMSARIPMFVEGFTQEVPYYMELADFFVGKPGPGSISEALAKRLPVIVQSNAWTMAHEQYNATWIREQGFGLVVGNFATEIRDAVNTLLEPANFRRFRENVAATRNTAVYEIPELLEGILASRSKGALPILAGQSR